MKKNSLFEKVMGYFSIFAFADTNTQANTQLNTELVHTVYSKEIEFKALPNMRFMQFAATKTELGTEPGLTISMLTYDNLKMGGQLSETASMTTQGLSGSTKQITVTEWGNAVQVSEKLLRSSFDDVMSSATTLLGRDYAMVADCALRDTALSGTNVVYAKTSAGAAVASRDKLDSTCTLKVSTIKESRDVTDGTKSVEIILNSFKVVIDLQRELLDITDKAGDEGTNSQMSDYITEQEKEVWMYNSYLGK